VYEENPAGSQPCATHCTTHLHVVLLRYGQHIPRKLTDVATIKLEHLTRTMHASGMLAVHCAVLRQNKAIPPYLQLSNPSV
jgi:hypothetical protein